MKRELYATATLIGSIVGVGLFGIPYVSVRAGLWVGLMYIAVLGVVMLTIHLLYGEIEERTEGNHRLTGYAQIYLGIWGKWIVGALVLIAGYGGLLVYLIVAGVFLDIIFPGSATPYLWTLGFWLVGSFAIWRGLRMVAWGELVMTVALVATMLIIVGKGIGHIVPGHLVGTGSSFADFFAPYGVVLFSLMGINAIPEVRAILGKHDGGRFKWVIIIGTLVPVLLYVLFTIAVVGVSGVATTEEAIRGLAPFLGSTVAKIGAIFGFLAVATSFLIFSINLKNTYVYDWGVGKLGAFLLVVFLPLVLFLLGMREFIIIVGITGALLGALSGPVIVWLYMRARKSGSRTPGFVFSPPKALLYMIGAIFILGGAYEIVKFFL